MEKIKLIRKHVVGEQVTLRGKLKEITAYIRRETCFEYKLNGESKWFRDSELNN